MGRGNNSAPFRYCSGCDATADRKSQASMQMKAAGEFTCPAPSRIVDAGKQFIQPHPGRVPFGIDLDGLRTQWLP